MPPKYTRFTLYDRYVDGEFHIGVFSSHDIQAESEITYDYRFKSFGERQKCFCGSYYCRGLIGIDKKDPLYIEQNGNFTLLHHHSFIS